MNSTWTEKLNGQLIAHLTKKQKNKKKELKNDASFSFSLSLIHFKRIP